MILSYQFQFELFEILVARTNGGLIKYKSILIYVIRILWNELIQQISCMMLNSQTSLSKLSSWSGPTFSYPLGDCYSACMHGANLFIARLPNEFHYWRTPHHWHFEYHAYKAYIVSSSSGSNFKKSQHVRTASKVCKLWRTIILQSCLLWGRLLDAHKMPHQSGSTSSGGGHMLA